MAFNLIQLPEIRKGEFPFLALVFAQALFLGVFLGSFDISMHAIFFDTHPVEDFILVYLIAGFLGIVAFFIYTFFSTRLPFKWFISLNYIVVLAAFFPIWFYTAVEANAQVIGIGFALVFPLNVLVFMNFWRFTREFFRPEQSKRLLGYLQLGFFGGLVISGYGIIAYLFIDTNLSNILLVSVISLSFAFILQLFANTWLGNSLVYINQAKKGRQIRSRFHELFYTRFTFLLVLFVMLSSTLGYLLHFDFIVLIRNDYPYIVGFTKFLGLYIGSLFLFVFVIDKVIIRKLLYSYDSPYSIVLIPAVLSLMVIVNIVLFFTVGGSMAIARFSFSFLIIAAIKLVYEMAKYNIEIPSLRVLFQTLDIRFHGTIIPRIDGTVRFAGLLLSGLLLALFVRLGLNYHLALNIGLVVLAIAWLVIAVMLIKQYQVALDATLKRFRVKKGEAGRSVSHVDEKLIMLINHRSTQKVINSLIISEKVEPIAFEQHLISLLPVSEPEVQAYVLEKIRRNSLLESIEVLKKVSFTNDSLEGKRTELLESFTEKISRSSAERQIEPLSQSRNTYDRVLACELIGYFRLAAYSSTLLNLSRDIEPEVKQTAVRAIARLSLENTCHALIGFLGSDDFYAHAFEALVRVGDQSIVHLEKLFDSQDTDFQLLARAVKIYGKIASPQACESLITKIERQNRFISGQALTALREARFQATPANINRILNLVVRTINTMSWNFSVFYLLKRHKRFTLLQVAFESEINNNYRQLFQLLSLSYNSTSVGNIKRLISEGNDTDISFAIELLDIIVLEDVKQVLFPVMENLSLPNRIKQLQYFFHTDSVKLDEVSVEILMRDFNMLSVYTKACALYSWVSIGKEIDNVIVAALFHPHPLMRETAAFVINRSKPEFLDEVYPRLGTNATLRIQNMLHSVSTGSDILLLDKVRFLKKIAPFSSLEEDILGDLSLYLQYVVLTDDETFYLANEKYQMAFICVYKGSVHVSIDEIAENRYEAGEVYFNPELLDNPVHGSFVISEGDSVIMGLKKEMFDRLIFDYPELRGAFLEMIDTQSV